MGNENTGPNCYQILQVHPAAPLDLVTAAYWWLVGQAQSARGSSPWAEASLHGLTRAYQTLAVPSARAAYDRSIGLGPQSPVPRLPRRRRSWLRRLLGTRLAASGDQAVDYYEVLRVDPGAEPPVISEAYSVMRDHYLRLVRLGGEPSGLLDVLEEAYATTSDPHRRRQYDAARSKRAAPRRQQRRPVPPPGAAASRGAAKAPRVRPARENPKEPAPRPQPVPRRRSPAPPAARTRAAGGTAKRQPRPRWASGTGRRIAAIAGRTPRLIGTAAILGRLSALALGRAAAQAGRGAWRLVLAVRESAPSAYHRPVAAAEEEALLRRLSTVPALDRQGSEPSFPEEGPADAAASANLSVVDGPRAGATFVLNGRPVVLGSEHNCDISLPGVAARQARLLYKDGWFVLHTLADDPTPRINDKPVTWAVLQDGDILTIGNHRLQFELGAK